MSTKVAVVTGAGGTLCSEMAKTLAIGGYHVALLGRTLEKLAIVENEINGSGGTAISISGDVSSVHDMEQAHETVLEKLGPCDVLINGAGGNQMDAITNINEFDADELSHSSDKKGFFNIEMKSFQNVLNINTMGTVIPSQIFARDMAKNNGGCIINIASMNSYRPLSRVAAYGMAKAGVVSFTQWLAAYLAPANIRVNAIAPGFFLNDKSRTRLTTPDGGFTDRGANILNHTPMKSFGKTKQLVGAMKWLINEDDADFVTGITIPVDGGFLACSGV